MWYLVTAPYESHGSPVPSSEQFQPRSAPAAYSYDNAPVADSHRYVSATNAIVQDNYPSSPATGMEIDPPIVIPPAPRTDELELQDPDHPFTYRGAHWDVSNGAFSVASTDGDAGSLHSQDRPSSRDSSEPIRGNRRDRKSRATDSPAAPEQQKASSEGRKKTVMACHFCRCKYIFLRVVISPHTCIHRILVRKLRCDGGHPCSHCTHREKECTYDTTIRRRGPGRRNKSAQETARVQLANRQREEAVREAVSQKETNHQLQGRITRSKAPKEEGHKDAWSQTSPQTNQFSASFSNSNMAFYPPDARSQLQFPTPDDSPTGGQEYQAFSIPFGGARGQEAVAPRPAREANQQAPFMHQYQLEGHRRAVSGPLAPGLQTPVSQGSPSYYDDSPDRASSQQYYPPSVAAYASNRYSIATQGGDSAYSYTDSESLYAYSEGANVLPHEHQQQQRESRQQQPDVQACLRSATGALQYSRQADGDVRMMSAYNDGRTRMEGYGIRR
ncbi:hypothetical protein B0J17DRAFT_448871 [Rhizoctonia solani]|nr:hypothetical protein B0J17DRAFT_448871 [Rhizoctonia solani]